MTDAAVPAGGVRDLRHSVLYLLPVAVGVALPILTLPILTRVLSTSDYGAWALANVYGSVATAAAGLGLPAVYERNFYEQRTPRDRGVLLHSIVAFVGSVLIAIGIATWYGRHRLSQVITGGTQYGALFFVAFCASAVVGVKAYYLTYFRNTGDARAYVRYTLDENVTGGLLSLLFVAVLKTGVVGMALGSLIASTVVLVLVVRRSLGSLPAVVDRGVLGASLRLSYPLAPRVLFKLVSNQFDKYLVALLSSMGGVGIYALGQRVAYSVFVLMNALENVFAPEVYRRMFNREGDGDGGVAAYLTPFLYVSTGAALCLVCLTPELLAVLTTADYQGAASIAAVLAVYYALLFFAKLPQLMFAKRTWLLAWVTAANVALSVLCCLWLTRRAGAFGAALGTMLAGGVSTILYVVLSQREFPIKWRWRPIAVMFGLLLASVAVVLGMTPATWVPSVPLRAALIAAYVLVGVSLGVVTRENFRMVLDAARRRAPGAVAPAAADASAAIR